MTKLDVSPDPYFALRRASLHRIEDQLRCTCGARRGTLEAWPALVVPSDSRQRLFLFLV